jgi:hypothetical protein
MDRKEGKNMASFPFHYEPENLAVSDKPDWVSATDGEISFLVRSARWL